MIRVLLVDDHVIVRDGLRALLKSAPDIQVVGEAAWAPGRGAMHNEEERLVPLLKDGARGHLSKDCADHDLIDGIRVVASGEFFVRPTVARILAANAMQRRGISAVEEQERLFETLSPRERAVLWHVATEYSGVEIGHMLGITRKTVDTYKNRIGQKLGFTHRTDYFRFALRLGLIGDDDGRSAQTSPAESS